MTIDNLLKKTLASSTLALSLLAATTCSSEDPAEQPEWPTDCHTKDYFDKPEKFCENFTGTYNVNATNCSAKFSEIQIEQFDECESENLCYAKGCEVVIIGKNIKDGSMECILPRSWEMVAKGNVVNTRDYGSLTQCNSDTIKLINQNGDCTYWLSKTLGQPKLFHDVDYKCSWTEGYIPLK
ncbi:MAG: hypothetical protein KKD75_04475 [Nanoarchaeota archaeon]|nr:hypothetical protein [Nanoarchaeota archaeon]MBU1876446.1 hypothetical protein [Nanoarchaeota archaeon]